MYILYPSFCVYSVYLSTLVFAVVVIIVNILKTSYGAASSQGWDFLAMRSVSIRRSLKLTFISSITDMNEMYTRLL